MSLTKAEFVQQIENYVNKNSSALKLTIHRCRYLNFLRKIIAYSRTVYQGVLWNQGGVTTIRGLW